MSQPRADAFQGSYSALGLEAVQALIRTHRTEGKTCLILASLASALPDDWGISSASFTILRDELHHSPEQLLDKLTTSFDLIVSDNAFPETIPLERLLHLLADRLNPNGLLLLTAPNQLITQHYQRIAQSLHLLAGQDIGLTRLILSDLTQTPLFTRLATDLLNLSTEDERLFQRHFLEAIPMGTSTAELLRLLPQTGLTLEGFADREHAASEQTLGQELSQRLKDHPEARDLATDLIAASPLIALLRKRTPAQDATGILSNAENAEEDWRRTSERVQRLYAKTPYPLNDQLSFLHHAAPAISFFTGRNETHPLDEACRILIAGCGTVQALNVALSFPKAQITAIDITPESLRAASETARHLGLLHVHFERRDLADLDKLEGTFDYIECLGVLHHLADPARGLNLLTEKLSAHGVMRIMVYAEAHRVFFQRIQQIVQKACGLEAKDAVECARLILARLATREGSLRLQGEHGLRLYREDLPQFCDTYLHPQECSFTFEQLVHWLGHARLRIEAFTTPHEWDVKHLFRSSEVLNRLANLTREEQQRLASHLTCGLFDFWAVRQEEEIPPRTWEHSANALLAIVPHKVVREARQIVNNRVDLKTCDVQCARFEPIPGSRDQVRFFLDPATPFVAHALVRDLYEHCDGKRTVEEIILAIVETWKIPGEQLVPYALELFRLMLGRMQMLYGG